MAKVKSCVSCLYKYCIPHLPDSHHAAAKQKTPFNINRYLLLLIYIIYTFLSACPYFGWTPLSRLLFKSGAYEWLCTNPNSNTGDSEFKCIDQNKNVSQLFTIAMASHFTMSAVAGFLIDRVGPKFTSLIGQTLNFIGWLLLGFCGQNFRGYIPAFMFIGAGSDVGFLPTLLLANVFPGSSAVCITILGSAVSASFAIPLIMFTIWDKYSSITFFDLCFGYIFIGPLLCAGIALLLIPYKSFVGEDSVQQLTKDNSSKELEGKGFNTCCDVFKNECFNDCNNFYLNKEATSRTNVTKSEYVCNYNESKTASTEFQEGSQISSNNLFKNEEKLHCNANSIDVTEQHSTASEESNKIEIGLSSMNEYSLSFASKDYLNKVEKNGKSSNEIFELKGVQLNMVSDSNKLDMNFSYKNSVKNIKEENRLRKLLVSKFYIVICLYFIICAITVAYYPVAAGTIFPKEIFEEKVLDTLLPFSFIPCIIIGKMIDLFGIMPIILFVNSAGLLSYFCVCFDVAFLYYLSIVLHVIYVSVLTSQVYCYVSDTFASHHFAKLIGIASCMGGLSSLVVNPLYDYVTVDAMGNKSLLMNAVFASVLAIMTPILVYIMLLKRKMVKYSLNAVQFTHDP